MIHAPFCAVPVWHSLLQMTTKQLAKMKRCALVPATTDILTGTPAWLAMPNFGHELLNSSVHPEVSVRTTDMNLL